MELAEAGVDRVIFQLPSAEPAAAAKVLDNFARPIF